MAYREFLALKILAFYIGLVKCNQQVPPIVEALQSFVSTGMVRALRQC